MCFKSYEHYHKLTTAGWTAARQSLVHQKGGFACQCLWNVDMYMHAIFD